MKHRSVIAFVIVAAALFAAPQLSHDLQSLRDALGSRLRGHLMHAFLSMPAGEVAPPATAAPLPARTSLETCSKGRPAARPRKAGPSASPRAELRAEEVRGDELAMITEPLPGPGPWTASLPAGARVRTAELPREVELAMIIPPELGIDPPGAATASAGREVERQAQRMARDVRVAYVATRVEGKGAEWVRQGEALQRRLEEGLTGAYEFRVDRDGSKRKVLKVKGAGPCCAPSAPRAPRAAGQDAATAPRPAVTSFEVLHAFAGE
jgi:hypothetical protein